MVAKGYKFGAAVPEGVDPRLDNRAGVERPPLESAPVVPQQVDGPDLVHQEKHARAVEKLAKVAEEGPRKGMFSPGDHSVSDEDARGGNHAGQADKLKETGKDSPASSSTEAGKGDVGKAGSRG